MNEEFLDNVTCEACQEKPACHYVEDLNVCGDCVGECFVCKCPVLKEYSDFCDDCGENVDGETYDDLIRYQYAVAIGAV